MAAKGRVNNRPPVPERALGPDGVAAVDSMVALGVPNRKIAVHLGVHWQTVAKVVHRKGAYESIPRGEK